MTERDIEACHWRLARQCFGPSSFCLQNVIQSPLVPSRSQITRLAEAIAASFDVDRIILFGSRARGTATKDSDADLLVVMRYAGGETEQAVAILSKTNPRFAVDLVVRTPADTARRYRQYDPLIRDALDNGVVLYAKRGAGMGRQSGRRLPVRAKAAAGAEGP